jgi:hypothetical protein
VQVQGPEKVPVPEMVQNSELVKDLELVDFAVGGPELEDLVRVEPSCGKFVNWSDCYKQKGKPGELGLTTSSNENPAIFKAVVVQNS